MSKSYDKLMKDAECNKYTLSEEIFQLGREDAIEEMIEVADCEHADCFDCAYYSAGGCKLELMLILRDDNTFFNFDKVIKIEKKKSYNQALEEITEKIKNYYKVYKVMPSIHCFLEIMEQLKEGNK